MPKAGSAYRWGLGALVLLAVVGLGLVICSDDSSRWAGLGSDLTATAGVGLLLVFFGHSVAERFSEEQLETRDAVARTAAPAPSVDDNAHESVKAPKPEAAAKMDTPTELIAAVEGWVRDTSRLDADQLRIRTYDRAGQYFQFFTVIVPGPTFRLVVHQGSFTFDQFKRAVLDVALREIRRAVDAEDVPLPNATTAFELHPDLEEAGRLASQAEDEPIEELRIPVP